MKRRTAALVVCSGITALLCVIMAVSCGMGKVELDEDFQKVLTYSFGDSREPLTVIQDRIRDSYGNAEERLNLELQLAQLLQSEATWECKDFACRQLRVIGTDKSIPVLGKLLAQEEFSDMARYALELNTDPKVDKALTKALKQASGKTLVGLLNTIGERGSSDSAASVEQYVNDSDSEVAAAAKDALTKIRG